MAAAVGGEDPKAIMDQCVQEAVTAGRTSLHAEDPLASFQVTANKSDELRLVLDLLDCNKEERVAHDNHKKYVLARNGATSFVYLAADDAGRLNGGASGMHSVQAQ